MLTKCMIVVLFSAFGIGLLLFCSLSQHGSLLTRKMDIEAQGLLNNMILALVEEKPTNASIIFYKSYMNGFAKAILSSSGISIFQKFINHNSMDPLYSIRPDSDLIIESLERDITESVNEFTTNLDISPKEQVSNNNDKKENKNNDFIQRKNTNTFSYTGLDRFPDDTDDTWNNRTYSMSDFYHQYTHVAPQLRKLNITQGSVGIYVVPERGPDTKTFLYITGSSTNHFGTNLCMLLNLFLMDIHASVVFINFGLEPREIHIIFNFFNTIQQLRGEDSPGHFYYREIDFKQNPPYLRRSYFASIYALKAIATVNIAEECKCEVFWLDAGDYVGRYFHKLHGSVKLNGVQTAQSRGTVAALTNPLMFDYFRDKIPALYPKKQMCSGGFLGLDYNNEFAYKNIGLMLRECCYRKNCIMPEGSQKYNHRYDQSALSILIHAYGLSKTCGSLTMNTVRFQYDMVVNREGFSKIVNDLLHSIEKKYNIANFTTSVLSTF